MSMVPTLTAVTATTLCGMARELARPVCRGDLSWEVADAALITATLRAERAGALGDCRAGEMIRLLRFFLRAWIERERTRRGIAAHRVGRHLKPLIAMHRPWRELVSEAHNINADAGFALTEDEVSSTVKAEVYFSLPPAAGRSRHGR